MRFQAFPLRWLAAGVFSVFATIHAPVVCAQDAIAPKRTIDFARQFQPILAKHCYLPEYDNLENRTRETREAKSFWARNLRIPRLKRSCGMRKRLIFPMNSYWLAGSDVSSSPSSFEWELSRIWATRFASEADECLPFLVCRFSTVLLLSRTSPLPSISAILEKRSSGVRSSFFFVIG